MTAEALLQADTPATACHLRATHETIASPLSLLPGPLHAAIASAMGTAASSGAMGHQPMSPAPVGERQPAACKAGSPAHAVSERQGTGTKRRRTESKSHVRQSSRADASAGPIVSSAVPYAANGIFLREHSGSATQRGSSSKATVSAALPASSGAKAPSALAVKEVAVNEDALSLAPCLGAHEQPAIAHLRLQAPKGVNDMADLPGSPGHVAAHSRKHAFLPGTQKNSCRVEEVQRPHAVNPVECMLSSHSRLDSSDPGEPHATAEQLCGGAPAEQDSDVVQPAAQQHAGGGGTRADAQHQTPEGRSSCDITASSALPDSTGPCTSERVAKEALLMLHDIPDPVAVPGEDVLSDKTSGHAVDDDTNCVNRPPPFPDVEGGVAYEVDKIVDKRCYRAGSQVRLQYLVRWKGYGPEDDTWQSRNSLRHARQVVQDYENTVLLN